MMNSRMEKCLKFNQKTKISFSLDAETHNESTGFSEVYRLMKICSLSFPKRKCELHNRNMFYNRSICSLLYGRTPS